LAGAKAALAIQKAALSRAIKKSDINAMAMARDKITKITAEITAADIKAKAAVVAAKAACKKQTTTTTTVVSPTTTVVSPTTTA